MARHKKRHHRKIRQQRFGDVPLQAIETQIEDSTSPQLSPALTMVRGDLTKTAITSVVLIAALIIISVLNSKYHWTLSVGSELYRLLHIR